MSALNFPRSCKSLLGSKVTRTKTGLTLATPWGSFLDFDATATEAAELAAFFANLAAHFERQAGAALSKPVASEPVASEPAAESVEAAEAFPDVDPHVVALPKVKRAYTKKVRK